MFLYVVDTCVDDVDLQALKESLVMSLSVLPQDAYVGLVTFGRMVSVHELTCEGLTRCFVFRGNKDYTAKQMQDQLNLSPIAAPQTQGGMPPQQVPGGTGAPEPPSRRFFQPINQCDINLTNLINEMRKDPWPHTAGRRSLRATGAALSVAVAMLEACAQGCGTRLMLFTGGPCTHGPGMIIDDDQRHTIRSHHTIEKDDCPYMRKAFRHYEGLANRLAQAGHTCDMFSCAGDQTGLMEMRSLCTMTGGNMFLGDNFKTTLFQQTWQRMFTKTEAPEGQEGHLQMGFSATMELKVSRELRLAGCLGPVTSANKKDNSNLADQDVAGSVGGTCLWRTSAIHPHSTFAFFFDIATQHGQGGQQQSGSPGQQQGFVQFLTTYTHPARQRRIRVTTVSRTLLDPANMSTQQISAGFDQEACAVVAARMAAGRSEANNEASADVIRWLDRTLIRLCQRFGEYVRDEPSSFRLPAEFTLFPQFIFHLRRSQFLQVFNNSPDETTFYRLMLMRETPTECLTMLQPVLYSYSLSAPPQPALLDATSIQPDTVLLLDTFFQVLIYHGEKIAAWVDQGYDKMEQYAHLRQVLQAPVDDAARILATRFPMPRYIETKANGSQARFLLAKVNPSVTQNAAWGSSETSPVLTDDVSLQVFMDHLKKLAVANPV